MRVRVILERERGEFRPQFGQRASATGDLHLAYRTVHNRRVGVLQLISADRQWSNLYDPKLLELAADRLRFVGHERVGSTWYTQEWVCELL